MDPRLLSLMAGASSNDNPIEPIAANFIVWLEGNKYNGTTWTPTKGPTPTTNGTIIASTINGYPAANFGTNAYFYYSSLTLPSLLCVFAVAYEASNSNPLLVEQSQNANSQNGFYYYTANGYPYGLYRSSVGSLTGWNPTSGSDWFPPSSLALGGINWDGTTFTLTYNNTTVPSANSFGNASSYASNINATNEMYVGSRAGSNLFFNGGYLAELILSPALNATDLAIVKNYLLTKYGL